MRVWPTYFGDLLCGIVLREAVAAVGDGEGSVGEGGDFDEAGAILWTT